MASNNTVQLYISNDAVYMEGINESTNPLYPGDLVVSSLGDGFAAHAVAGGLAEFMFVVEDPYVGKEITDGYDLSRRVLVRIPRAGDIMLARVDRTLVITFGDRMVSYGAGATGRLKPSVDPDDFLLAYSMATMSVGFGTSLLKVRIA